MGGLFQITLFTYSQQGRKSEPETPHFGEVFGSKIDPRSRKSGSEIFTKIKSIFNQIFNRFWLHFGPHGPPQNSRIFIDFWSWCRSWAILAPRGCPKCSKTAPEVDFSRILYHFGVNFGRFCKDFRMHFYYNFSRLMSHSMLLFPLNSSNTVSARSSNFQFFGTVAAFRA